MPATRAPRTSTAKAERAREDELSSAKARRDAQTSYEKRNPGRSIAEDGFFAIMMASTEQLIFDDYLIAVAAFRGDVRVPRLAKWAVRGLQLARYEFTRVLPVDDDPLVRSVVEGSLSHHERTIEKLIREGAAVFATKTLFSLYGRFGSRKVFEYLHDEELVTHGTRSDLARRLREGRRHELDAATDPQLVWSDAPFGVAVSDDAQARRFAAICTWLEWRRLGERAPRRQRGNSREPKHTAFLNGLCMHFEANGWTLEPADVVDIAIAWELAGGERENLLKNWGRFLDSHKRSTLWNGPLRWCRQIETEADLTVFPRV